MSKNVKVVVMKMEVVEGKKMGKTLTLNLNLEEMTQYATSAMVRKRVMESVAKARVFAVNELKDLKYDMKELLKEWRAELKKKEGERSKKMNK